MAPRLEAMWTSVIWGTPLLIALAFLLRLAFGADAPLAAFFWTVLLLLVTVAAMLKSAGTFSVWLRSSLGIALITVAAVHLIALEPNRLGVIALDALLILSAVGLAPKPPWRWPQRRGHAYVEAPQPAE